MVVEVPEQPAPTDPPSDCSCINDSSREQQQNCSAELSLNCQPVDEQIKRLFYALMFGMICCTVSQCKVQSRTASMGELKRYINQLSTNV